MFTSTKVMVEWHFIKHVWLLIFSLFYDVMKYTGGKLYAHMILHGIHINILVFTSPNLAIQTLTATKGITEEYTH